MVFTKQFTQYIASNQSVDGYLSEAEMIALLFSKIDNALGSPITGSNVSASNVWRTYLFVTDACAVAGSIYVTFNSNFSFGNFNLAATFSVLAPVYSAANVAPTFSGVTLTRSANLGSSLAGSEPILAEMAVYRNNYSFFVKGRRFDDIDFDGFGFTIPLRTPSWWNPDLYPRFLAVTRGYGINMFNQIYSPYGDKSLSGITLVPSVANTATFIAPDGTRDIIAGFVLGPPTGEGVYGVLDPDIGAITNNSGMSVTDRITAGVREWDILRLDSRTVLRIA